MMSRISFTDPKTIIIGTLILLLTVSILVFYLYGEYKRNKQDIETDEEIDRLKSEIRYWKYEAEHPHLRLTLEGEGWEDVPDEYK